MINKNRFPVHQTESKSKIFLILLWGQYRTPGDFIRFLGILLDRSKNIKFPFIFPKVLRFIVTVSIKAFINMPKRPEVFAGLSPHFRFYLSTIAKSFLIPCDFRSSLWVPKSPNLICCALSPPFLSSSNAGRRG